MGLAELFLGADNPFAKYVADNRQTVKGAFAGFGQGTNFGAGLGNAAIGAQRGALLDDVTRSDTEAEKQRVAQINATAEFLRAKGANDLAAAVEGGMTTGADAFNQWYQQANAPAASPDPFTLGAGDIRYDGYGNVIAQGAPSSRTENAPSGYQYTPDGNLSFIPGGPADPSTQAKTTEAQRRNQQLASVIQPELVTVEQNWDALADGRNQTWGSNPVTAGMASPEYQQARNSLNVIAQSYLYSVSGAAATDAEVQKIVDSVTPKPFESPQSIAAKKARIQQMADAVIQAGGGAQQQPPGGQTSTGLQWSIEP